MRLNFALQVQYVFSDKTGTLTQNVMEYKRASIAGRIFEAGEGQLDQPDGMKRALDANENPETAPVVADFMALLSVCHTVIPEKNDDGTHKVGLG